MKYYYKFEVIYGHILHEDDGELKTRPQITYAVLAHRSLDMSWFDFDTAKKSCERIIIEQIKILSRNSLQQHQEEIKLLENRKQWLSDLTEESFVSSQTDTLGK